MFDRALVADLPDPARRYFLYTLKEGAPLHRAVEIEMKGLLSFGNKENPAYRPMQARQILAPPFGLVWHLKCGAVIGSDAALPDTSWTRFWLFGVFPVVRAGSTRDHHLSAFGRVVAEAAIWAPAALLPGDDVRWEQLDANSARATVTFRDYTQAVDITVAKDGQPQKVLIQRWSNANPQQQFRFQPFGGTLSNFRDFGGTCLPTTVEGGNHFGTDDYFPFYKAAVTSVRAISASWPSGQPSPAKKTELL